MTDTAARKLESREFLKYPVTKTYQGSVADPTTDSVYFAFLPSGTRPVDADWVDGDWEIDPSGPTYYARVLVGAGGVPAVPLALGTYQVWLRILDDPEHPIRVVGVLKIT